MEPRQLYLKVCPGWPLVFEVGYHPRKKIHVIRIVFQTQVMYTRTSFRGAKTCKIGKKGVFLDTLTNFGKDVMDKMRKNACKNAYLGSIFMPKKYVFRVFFESPFTRMISSLKYKCSPGMLSGVICSIMTFFAKECHSGRIS